MKGAGSFLALALLAAPVRAAAPAPAPEFTLTLLDGTKVASRELAGRIVVLNFWATWCVPCRRELAEMDAVARKVGRERLAIYAIDVDRGRIRRLVNAQAMAMTIPIAIAVESLPAAYRPIGNAVPSTFLIDPRGRLLLARSGALAEGEFARLMASYLSGKE